MAIDWFPLWLSLRVAVISTAVALVIGLWLAWLLANRQFRGKELLDAAVGAAAHGAGLLSAGRAWTRHALRPALRIRVRSAAGFHLASGRGRGLRARLRVGP